MAKDAVSIQHQLGVAEALSKQFSVEASSLSDMLVHFERTLGTLDGRADVGAQTEAGGRVTFSRNGQNWALFYYPQNGQGRLLSAATLEEKLDAIAALPQLVTTLVEGHADRLSRIRHAKATLVKLLPTLRQLEQGGA